MLSRLLLPASLLVAAVVAGCPTDPPGKEGEGEEGEGEGADEGEGEEGEGEEGEGEPALPTPTATLTSSPRFAVPADGLTAYHLIVKLAPGDVAAPIGDRTVSLQTSPAGPEEVAAALSDGTGVVAFDVVSSVAGDFAVEVSVDGVVVPTGDLSLQFTPCRSLEDTFLVDAWPVALSRCIGCHNEFGFAPSLGARYVLPFPGDDDFAAKGVQAVRDILQHTADDGLDFDVGALDADTRAALALDDDEVTLPLLLANPILGDLTGHTGGVVITPAEREEIARFRSFVARVQAGDDTCGAGSAHGLVDENLLDQTTLLSPTETMKKATLTLTGAPAVGNAGLDETSLASRLDDVLADPRAEQRLTEIWNDWLLTDQNIGKTPTYLGTSFPNRDFFEKLQSEGATGGASCNDSIAGKCCRVPEDPLNLDADPDNNVAPKPENVLCEQKRLEIRTAGPREPIDILLRIYREDRPAAELITGDYTVVDPSLARAYGLVNDNGRTFKDGVTTAFNANPADDTTERRVVRVINTDKNNITGRNATLDAWPHQGIFSTPSYLARYQTTTSNRERTRARQVYEKMLGVPVMKLAAFATPEIPAGQSLENLTWDTQPCIVCHTLLDPVAAQFNHWSGNGGSLTARRPCRNDGMRSPGFGFIALPGTDDENAGVFRASLDEQDGCVAPEDGSGAGAQDTRGPERLRWLGDRIVEHPRFAYGVVLPLYEGLTGAPILSAPDALIDPDFAAKARAFATQQKELATYVDAFRAGGGRFRPVIKAILLGKTFRAAATATALDDESARALELMNVGAGALLTTPEVLDRKILSLTGIPWTHLRGTNAAQQNNLVDDAFYGIFAGGIDSNTVTLRSRDPVAVRAAVARRLGNELSCIAVPQDFSIVNPAQRRLFSLVEIGDAPLDDDGNIVAAADARVVAQIRKLHELLWNEDVVDEAEVEASHQLFLNVIRALRAPSDGGTTAAGIGGTCQATSLFVKLPAGTARPAYPSSGTVVIDGVEHRRVQNDPDFTVRAWMAVTSSLLADGRFLFE